MIHLNKADLADDLGRVLDEIAAAAPGIPRHVISVRAQQGTSEIERYFEGNKTVGLVGSSGVGKSSLTNVLLGRAAQATQEVRAHDSRGRHTTTHRQLFLRPLGGAIVDTPGMRGIEVWKTSPDVEDSIEVVELANKCRFRNCSHTVEPGCAVRAAKDDA